MALLKIYKGAFLLILVLLYVEPIIAQPDHSGFKPFPLPKADQYTVKNWLNVEQIGPQIPFDESKVAVFADNIEIDGLRLKQEGGAAKHILLVADVVRLGKNNDILMRSGKLSQKTPKTEAERAGGSFIILCRRFIVQPEASLKFNGATFNPEKFDAHHTPIVLLPAFTGGYGAQLLIAAEEVEIEPAAFQVISSSVLKAIELNFRSLIGNRMSNLDYDGKTFRYEMLRILEKNKHLLPSQDEASLAAKFSRSNVIDESTIKAALSLIRLKMERLNNKEKLSTLFAYDEERSKANYNSGYPPKPFEKI